MERDFAGEFCPLVEINEPSENRIVEERRPVELRIGQDRVSRDFRAAKIGEAHKFGVGKIGVSIHLRLKLGGRETGSLEARFVHELRASERAFRQKFRFSEIRESAKSGVVETGPSDRARAGETRAKRKISSDETDEAGEHKAAEIWAFGEFMVAEVGGGIDVPALRMRVGEIRVAL